MAIAAAALGQDVEPIWSIPADVVAFFIPGLPANLVDIVAKFPVPAVIALFTLVMITIASRCVQLEENEYMFQRWRIVLVAAAMPPKPIPPPISVRIICILASIVSTVLMLASVVVVLIALVVGICFACFDCSIPDTLLSSSNEPTVEGENLYTPVCCRNTVSPRQLFRDESVVVKIAASRKRNRTGLLLEEGEWYTAEYVNHEQWSDGRFRAQPGGVEYDGLARLSAWAMEWLRPYPGGVWFQVVGRIDRSREVFAVLGAGNASREHEFVAPEDGELVLLVNDVHYANNGGWMTIRLSRRTDLPRKRRRGHRQE
ncbi:MAG: hypothetical protein OXC15_09485 [Rhodospirillaceae bacterium]|nr:hypothetical protein [Rhodospirillaceae bacterium]